VLRLAGPKAVQPVTLIYRDPEPASRPVQAFLRLICSRWAP
jgi:hypothetical protein